jgi:P27 family predicted phage terminase small subunit
MSKGGKNPSSDKKLDSRNNKQALRNLEAYPKLHLFPFDLSKKPKMSKMASDHWGDIVIPLAHLGVICELDKPMVVMMCELWVQWHQVTEQVHKRKLGVISIDEDGLIDISPLVRESERIEKRLMVFYRLFGMAPGYRPNIGRIPGIKLGEIDVEKPAADLDQLSEWDKFA